MLNIGDQAPDFLLQDQDGNDHSLHQYRGKKVLLFFYPKDHTPGCTIEVQQLQLAFQELSQYSLVLLGINADSPKRHKSFCDKHSLIFTLLSDPTKTTIGAYEAGNWLIVKRISYLIDEQGTIIHIFPKVSPKEHAKEVLNILRLR